LDLFKRARGDWVKKVKAAGVIPDAITTTIPVTSEAQDGGVGEGEGGGKKKGRKDKKKWEGKNTKVSSTGKSAIQLAREKFAAQDALKKEMKNSKGTGANSAGVRLRK
jgi:nucleolar protein 9